MTKRKALTAAEMASAILAADDVRTVPVECPEWKNPTLGFDGTVYVREMSEKAYSDWVAESNEGNQRPSTGLLLRTLCSKDGDLLYDSEQIEAIREKSIKVVNRIAEAALEVNGLKVKDEEEIVGKLSESDSTSG